MEIICLLTCWKNLLSAQAACVRGKQFCLEITFQMGWRWSSSDQRQKRHFNSPHPDIFQGKKPRREETKLTIIGGDVNDGMFFVYQVISSVSFELLCFSSRCKNGSGSWSTVETEACRISSLTAVSILHRLLCQKVSLNPHLRSFLFPLNV